MKGPGLRTALDVRRLWVCPQCGRKVKLPGHVVSQQCEQDGVWMQLVEQKPTPPPHRPIGPPVNVAETESQAQPAAETEVTPTLVTADAKPQEASTGEPASDKSETAESPTLSEMDATTEPPSGTAEPVPPTPPADAQPTGDAAATSDSENSGEQRGKKKRRRKRRRKGRGK